MCGLVGVICKGNFGFNNEQLNVFSELLWVDALRGFDSTGVFSVNNIGNVYWAKESSNPGKFLLANEYKTIKQNTFTKGKVLVGHNRKATKGQINDANAHPFVENNIVLVHNGTIYNQNQLDGAAVDVDSHAICHDMAINGYKETLKKINGAFAIIWYDTKTEKLYLTRNKERPLHFVETPQSYIISSEQGILELILKRNQITTIKSIYYVEPETVIAFDLKKNDYTIEDLYPKKQQTQQKVLQITHKKQKETKKNSNVVITTKNEIPEFKNTNPKELRPPFRQDKYLASDFTKYGYIDWIPESIILFDDNKSQFDGIINGHWLYNESVKVKWFFNIDIFDWLDFSECDYLIGNVSETFNGSNNNLVVMVKDTWAMNYGVTHNGELLSEEFIETVMDNTCVVCKTDCDDLKDPSKFSFKFKGSTHRFVCPDCVEKSKTKGKQHQNANNLLNTV